MRCQNFQFWSSTSLKLQVFGSEKHGNGLQTEGTGCQGLQTHAIVQLAIILQCWVAHQHTTEKPCVLYDSICFHDTHGYNIIQPWWFLQEQIEKQMEKKLLSSIAALLLLTDPVDGLLQNLSYELKPNQPFNFPRTNLKLIGVCLKCLYRSASICFLLPATVDSMFWALALANSSCLFKEPSQLLSCSTRMSVKCLCSVYKQISPTYSIKWYLTFWYILHAESPFYWHWCLKCTNLFRSSKHRKSLA